jgi:hypothetical protein
MHLPDLPLLLSWKHDQNPLLEDIAKAHIEARAVTISRLKAGSSAIREVVATLLSLPSSAILEILDSPEMMNALLKAKAGACNELTQFVEESVAAERARLEIEQPATPVWSAKGDAYFGSHGERWFSNRIAGIVVDSRSPHARRPLQVSAFRESKLGISTPIGIDLEEHIYEKIFSAWELLGLIAPRVERFVKAWIQCLIPRCSENDDSYFTSSSSRAFIGRAVLLNPHGIAVSAEMLLSAFVHEAVHSFLYRLEHFTPFLIDESAIHVDLISPWSGGRVRLLTYVHACFVYYALAMLWNGVLETGASCVDSEVVCGELARVGAGFSNYKLLNQLRPYLHLLQPDIREYLFMLPLSVKAVNYG